MQEAAPTVPEAEVQQLAQAIAAAAGPEFLLLARTLLAGDRAALFGATEFAVRDILLRVGAKAYQQHLEQKKTATPAPA